MECEVYIDGIRLGHASEFKYLGCILDECSRKVAGAIRSLVNARDFHIEGASVLHETLLVPVLMYGSETIL